MNFNHFNPQIYDDESHYIFSYNIDQENDFSNLFSYIEVDSQIPSSDKTTNFADHFEQKNISKSDENNKIKSNDLNISQENNNLEIWNEKEEKRQEIPYFNEDNNLPELSEINEVNELNEVNEVNNNNIGWNVYYEAINNSENTISQNKSEKNQNTRCSPDNLIRKVKHILLDSILHFLNKTLIKVYNNKIGNGIAIKQFKPLNQKAKSDPNIQYNKELLHKNLEEILSETISKRMTNYSPFHNQNLVQYLLNEKNNSIKIIFKKLFCLTFFDYLKHFIGNRPIDILKGMNTLNKELQIYSDDPDYYSNLKYYFENYDIIINKKKTRKSKKNKENKKKFELHV